MRVFKVNGQEKTVKTLAKPIKMVRRLQRIQKRANLTVRTKRVSPGGSHGIQFGNRSWQVESAC